MSKQIFWTILAVLVLIAALAFHAEPRKVVIGGERVASRAWVEEKPTPRPEVRAMPSPGGIAWTTSVAPPCDAPMASASTSNTTCRTTSGGTSGIISLTLAGVR